MTEDQYNTISVPTTGNYKDKGSKFFSFAYPVTSESEIKDILKELRKKYYDARHFCFAYRLGADKSIYRDSDDGEPANSAGKPIMRQIQSKNLTDILIVVIRYFGGTLLGISGLIKAYGSAAYDALNNSEIVTKTVYNTIKINIPYTYNNIVQKIIREEKLKIINQSFEQICSFIINIKQSDTQRIIERFKHIEDIECKILNN